MHGLRKALWNAVFTTDVRLYGRHLWDRMEDFSTLLLGETGTGKGSAAAAIGRSGLIPFEPRRGRFAQSFTGTFLAINLSQFPETLIESELFGHRKGAFTGAVDHHRGVFERCSARGSLFLDEIGDVTEPVQIKLLNVLQERSYAPVGSHESRRFAGRVIAATNRPLGELRRSGRFRDDFYYRLSSNVIRVPALRERIADAPEELGQLAGVLLGRLVGEGAAPQLTDQVLTALEALPRDYPWPGNVRELEQAIRRILVTGSYAPEAPAGDAGDDAWRAALEAGTLDAAALLGGYCARLHRSLGTYEAVAERVGLDRRTVRKHVERARTENFPAPAGPQGEGTKTIVGGVSRPR
jgi:DNA-binding NtrC family response regulator